MVELTRAASFATELDSEDGLGGRDDGQGPAKLIRGCAGELLNGGNVRHLQLAEIGRTRSDPLASAAEEMPTQATRSQTPYR